MYCYLNYTTRISNCESVTSVMSYDFTGKNAKSIINL